MPLLGLASARTEIKARWVAAAAGLALLFALSAATPLHDTLYSLLPGVGKARIPVRASHILNLGLCILAAYGLDGFLAGQSERGTRLLRQGLLL